METRTADQTGTILTRLKERTAHRHQQTEDGVALMRDDFTLADYRLLLEKFYAFYLGFETKMRESMAAHPVAMSYQERLNTPKLRADLRHLGLGHTEIDRIAPCRDLPALDSPEKIFGALYVVEGSTLGGQYISRHLKDKFGLDETGGISFFSGYGAETGKMWNAFRAAVTEFADRGANHEEIIMAADETFEKIGNCLSA